MGRTRLWREACSRTKGMVPLARVCTVMKRRLLLPLVSALALSGLAALPAAAQQPPAPLDLEDGLEGAPGSTIFLSLVPVDGAEQITAAPLPPAPEPAPPPAPELPVIAPAVTPAEPAAPALDLVQNQPTPAASPLETAAAPLLADAPPAADQPETAENLPPASPEEDAARLFAGAENCRYCALSGIDLSYRDLPSRDLSHAVLAAADLSLGTFDKARFADANLSGINGFGVRAMSADFTGANLSGATFVGSWLGGSVFTGANFAGANLGGANMARTMGLTQSQLNQACGDAWTVLPRGLTVPSCLP